MESRKQDVVVIGAGIIGLATAYELSKRGAQVTVLEENEPGMAASRGNAGMIYPALCEPMVNPHHAKAGVGWVLTRGGESPLQFSMMKMPSLAGWMFRALRYCTQDNFDKGREAFGMLGADTFKLYDGYKQDGIEFEEHPDGLLATFIHEKQFESAKAGAGQSPDAEIFTGDQARLLQVYLLAL